METNNSLEGIQISESRENLEPMVVWAVRSTHALLTCFQTDKGIFVKKEISPENVNVENAAWVNRVSVEFRRKLHQLGVLLVEPYTFSEENGKAIQTSPYVGFDLENLFDRGEGTYEIIEKLIFCMKGVLTQTILEVGIDARLSNFCLGEDGEVRYVDTFPPLMKYEEGYIVHFPNPENPDIVKKELKRKFNPFGIIRRLRFGILEQDNGIGDKEILLAIEKVIGKEFADNMRAFIQTLPDHLDIKSAISQMTLEDPEGIRELAISIMPRKSAKRREFFREIFELSSHFGLVNLSEQEKMDRIRDLFTKNMSM